MGATPSHYHDKHVVSFTQMNSDGFRSFDPIGGVVVKEEVANSSTVFSQVNVHVVISGGVWCRYDHREKVDSANRCDESPRMLAVRVACICYHVVPYDDMIGRWIHEVLVHDCHKCDAWITGCKNIKLFLWFDATLAIYRVFRPSKKSPIGHKHCLC